MQEKRKIKYKGELYVLHEYLMKEVRFIEKSIIMPDGTLSDVCNHCVNRLENLTIGCQACKPVRTKK
jgi:hypothetical protein